MRHQNYVVKLLWLSKAKKKHNIFVFVIKTSFRFIFFFKFIANEKEKLLFNWKEAKTFFEGW
jgi:hypothetical protein